MNPRIPQIIADLVAFDKQLKATNDHDTTANLLGNIKLYAAQLYLETDMEIISHATSSATPIQPEDSNKVTASIQPPPFTPELEPISASNSMDDEAESTVVEGNPIAENQGIMETEQFVIDSPEIIEEDIEIQEFEENDLHLTQEDTLVEAINKAVEEVKYTTETPQNDLFSEREEVEEEQVDADVETVENEPTLIKKVTISNDESSVNHVHYEQKATEILSMFSFSRRFEFGNFLFGGDMKLFSVFITEMLAAGSADAREDVFDTWYQQRQWSRRDESANDLKRNLKKMM